MSQCEDIQRQLTGYLEGEADGERGSVVRGHLRACAACRLVASDEAALRDGLRALPTLDPPASLWVGVQAQLAAAEVADARRPAWRRLLTRWAPRAPSVLAGGLVAATAVAVLWWRAHRVPGEVANPPAPPLTAKRSPVDVPPATPTGIDCVAPPPLRDDVTADLAQDAERITASYAQAADELSALATEARAQWSEDRQRAFDAQLVELRAAIDRVDEGRPRQRAWRALIRYLQGAVIRDDVALAGGGR